MKKYLSAVLSTALLVTSMSFSANAAGGNIEAVPVLISAGSTSTDTAKAYEPTTEEMETIIKLVKPKFDVPEEFKEFTWNYYAGSYDQASIWSLTWSKADNTGNVTINADKDGHIQSYNKYVQKSNYKSVLPTYLKSDLESKATEFLTKIVPEAVDSLKLKSTTCYGIYAGSYNYNFVRYENDIPFPSNTASVSIDNITGEVTAFNITYDYDLEGKKPTDPISSEKAIELLKKEQSMVLSYRTKYETNEKGERKASAYLVYTPLLSYVSIDAQSGEIYKETAEWKTVANGTSEKSPSAALAGSKDAAVSKGDYQLNDNELKQLDVLKNLISREDAIKAVTGNDSLYINPALTTVNATLQKTGNYRSEYYYGNNYDCDYYWSINFTNPKPDTDKKYDYSYANAVVNAENGNLIAFNASLYEDAYYSANKIDVPKVTYTDEQAKAIMEGFLKAQIPEKFENSKFTTSAPIHVLKYVTDGDIQTPVYGAYSYNYNRTNEGVEYSDNNINGSVDGVTGKIVSFGYNWNNDIVFESPQNAISADKAYEIFMNLDGFGLNYETKSNYTYNEYLLKAGKTQDYVNSNDLYAFKKEVRLVYSSYDTNPAILSAITGKQIDYSGDVYLLPQSNSEGYQYKDISGHWAEKIIQLFGDVNVGFKGGSFLPENAITTGEFKQLMNTAGLYDSTSDIKKSDVKADGSVAITRVDAVKAIVNALGFSEIATIKEIFKTDFADNLAIKDTDIGYVAIARGLGIIQGSDGNFRPYDTITRAEALTLLKNTIMR